VPAASATEAEGGAAGADGATCRKSNPQLSQKIAPVGAGIPQLGQIISDMASSPSMSVQSFANFK
jgi:hypothetical protein